jgi:hypothetical protein
MFPGCGRHRVLRGSATAKTGQSARFAAAGEKHRLIDYLFIIMVKRQHAAFIDFEGEPVKTVPAKSFANAACRDLRS